MALRIAFVSAGIVTIFAQQTNSLSEDDSVVLLQGAVEIQSQRSKENKVDLEADDKDKYKLAEPLSCAPKEGALVQPLVSMAGDGAAAPDESAVAAPDELKEAEEDPPGTAVVKMALQLGIVLLICDGLRKWHLQRQLVEEKSSQCKQAKPAQAAVAAQAAWVQMVKAAKSGDECSFEEALAHNPVIMQSDAWGCTPLHFAAAGGSTAIASKLLTLGADVDALDAIDETPLHIAARTGGVPFCDLLLKARAHIDAVNNKGMSPLVLAGHADQEPTCRFLADNGAGVAGLLDEELPLLVVSQFVRKVLTSS